MYRLLIALFCICIAGQNVSALHRVDSYRSAKLRASEEASDLSFVLEIVRNMNENLQGIFHDVAELKKTTAALEETTASLQSQITDLSSSVNENIKALNASLTQKVEKVNESLTTSIAALSSVLIGKIATVVETQGDINKQLNASLTSVNSTLSADICKLDGEVEKVSSTLSAKIDAVNADVCSQISQLNATLSGDFADVSSSLTADVKKLEDEEKALANQVNAQITTLNKDVTSQSAKLEQLTTSVEQHVSTLQGEINDLELLDECYYYEDANTNGSWADAQKYCVANGGNLAFHKMQSMESRREIALDTRVLGSGSFYWWGLSKKEGTQDWVLVDGSAPTSTESIHWGPDFPNNGTGMDCVAMFVNTDNPIGLYSVNTKCESQLSAICEYKC